MGKKQKRRISKLQKTLADSTASAIAFGRRAGLAEAAECRTIVEVRKLAEASA